MVDYLNNYYNLTGLQNASKIIDVVSVANNVSGGFLTLFFIVALFIVGVITFKAKLPETVDAIMVSSLMCFFLSGLASLAGLIDIWWCLLWLFILAFSAAFAQITRG